MNPAFGTDPHTLHRTDSIDTSVAAAYSVDTTKLEETVYQCIKAAGVYGCTQDDVLAKNPDAPYSSITARFSALLRKHLIVDTGTRRKGRSGRAQRVVYVPPHTFSLVAGDLPEGLTLHKGGKVSGKICEPGVTEFTLRVVDADGEQGVG